jgi:hypothetical protein
LASGNESLERKVEGENWLAQSGQIGQSGQSENEVDGIHYSKTFNTVFGNLVKRPSYTAIALITLALGLARTRRSLC